MNPIPLPWMLLGVLVALIGAGSMGYIEGGKHMRDKMIAQAAKEESIRQETRQLSMQAAAEAISKIEVRNVTIRQRAETVTREVPVYRDCRHDPDGLQLVNQALAGTPIKPTDRGKLPETDTPDG